MARTKKPEATTEELPMKTVKPVKNYVSAIGRRKEAVARVRIYPQVKEGLIWEEKEVKKGDIWVNGIAAEHFFDGIKGNMHIVELMRVTNTVNRFAITVKVAGGGKRGQLDATIHGIARAMSELDREVLRPIPKKRR